jgi:hypothetical protein
LIDFLAREYIDHVIVLGESHLRRLVSLHASYCNEARTHLALAKDAPTSRPIELFGRVIASSCWAACITATRKSSFP